MTAKDRTQQLKRLDIPTTVIHGDADPLVNPSGGRATAAAIPGSRLVMIPGMGHDLPPKIWAQIIGEIDGTAARYVSASCLSASPIAAAPPRTSRSRCLPWLWPGTSRRQPRAPATPVR